MKQYRELKQKRNFYFFLICTFYYDFIYINIYRKHKGQKKAKTEVKKDHKNVLFKIKNVKKPSRKKKMMMNHL